MKIGEARQLYYSNSMQLTKQLQNISKRREEAERNYALTKKESYYDEAASLELSYDSVNKIYEENQKVLDALANQWTAVSNAESSKQAGEAMEEEAANLGKIMLVFRRMSQGDIVPLTDEKKLMEYDDKMYQVAKNMQARELLEKKKHKEYDSLWGEKEEKAYDEVDVGGEIRDFIDAQEAAYGLDESDNEKTDPQDP